MLDAWLDAVVLLRIGANTCSGVVLEPGHLVATAYHCVATGLRPEVELRSGETLSGRTVARDVEHDLALVAVDGLTGGLPLRTDDPVIGERVYGLGHPYAMLAGGKLTGVLLWSASEGIVSGVGDWLIQTDAALNPGNSGGPLVDGEGRVVGIVSRKLDADNLAFCAKAKDVDALVGSRDMGSPIGGTFGIGPVVTVGRDTGVLGELTVSIRERVVGQVGLGYAITAQEPIAITTVSGRQRFGTGPLSTTLDLGAGAWFGSGVTPVVTGRVSAASLGLGAMWEPIGGRWSGVISVEWPGVMGVF